MGSHFEINDTLQITKEQGFPAELDIDKHLEIPFTSDQFRGRIFCFKDKPNIRIFQAPPVRVFLVESIGGKWVCWGLVHIQEITHDYINKTTSGKFKIIYLNSPEEMKQVFDLVYQNEDLNYFKG